MAGAGDRVEGEHLAVGVEEEDGAEDAALLVKGALGFGVDDAAGGRGIPRWRSFVDLDGFDVGDAGLGKLEGAAGRVG